MTQSQQTDIRLACAEMVLRVNEMNGGSRDVVDTEDLIEKAEHLYLFFTTGRNIYAKKEKE